ncbi:hypothetical protein BCR42DRAFT_454506 [Absidia repens]|uniref:Uncharacterized protein n=1 Tax=Absidia repens TaxID=90262 RepID=A0A1X2I6H8_9FUNG|nr:hypothetical protein BCR42DRAFT_454506 [Absidia repens]
MDENTSPVSTPGSENSSPIHDRFSPLQSKTNKSRHEILSDGGKKHSTTSSPRSPLYEKNLSVVTPPYINRQPLQQQHRHSSSPSNKQRQQKSQQYRERRENDDDTCINHDVYQQKQHQQKQRQQYQQQQPQQQQQQRQQQQSISPHPERSNLKDDDNLPHQRTLDEETKALQQEVDALKMVLKAERQQSVWMSTWEKKMVGLIKEFKELQADVDDSVDILVEFDQVERELAVEQEKQAQVDDLMNLVPQRLFEIEELNSKLSE